MVGGHTGGRNVDVPALHVGASVSLNASGTRLAVGARHIFYGGVYLFTFTDDAFSGGQFALGIASSSDHFGDYFGTSVSLNASGSRLAVGAPGDGGAGNRADGAGAVYLYTFTDDAFSGGQLAAVVGKGYTGGENVDVGALEERDKFGTSVSLNASAGRLAVGASWDDGAGNQADHAGAVYLYTFTDDAFSGRTVRGGGGQGLHRREERRCRRAGGGLPRRVRRKRSTS